MFSFWRKIQERIVSWLMRRLNPDDLLEMKSVTTEKVTLSSVLLHNEMVLKNKLWVSYTILRLRGDLYNEQKLKVGWIDLAEPVKVKGRSETEMTVETHLSHITALFNVLRFWVKDNIPLELNGKVWIKVLWWDFSLPLKKTLYIRRDLVSYAAKAARTSPAEPASKIPPLELEPDAVEVKEMIPTPVTPETNSGAEQNTPVTENEEPMVRL